MGFGVDAPQLLADGVGSEHDRPERTLYAASDGRLPSAGQSADEYESHPTPSEVLPAQMEQGSGLRPGSGVALRPTDARDLGPDLRPVGDVVMGQRVRPEVARNHSVSAQEMTRQVGPAQTLEIHGQKCHVGEDVAGTEPIVELEAIEHPGPVVEAEDVVGQEVPVAVTGPPLFHPMLEERPATGEEPRRERRDVVQHVGVKHISAEGLHGRAVRRPSRDFGVDTCDLVDPLRTLRVTMEPGQKVGQAVEVAEHRRPADHQRRQPPVVGHAAHHEEMIQERPVRPRHVGDPQVHVRRQPTVERKLLLTCREPRLARPEIHESQVEGLLHLVGTVAQEEDHSGMGFRDGSGRRPTAGK